MARMNTIRNKVIVLIETFGEIYEIDACCFHPSLMFYNLHYVKLILKRKEHF